MLVSYSWLDLAPFGILWYHFTGGTLLVFATNILRLVQREKSIDQTRQTCSQMRYVDFPAYCLGANQTSNWQRFKLLTHQNKRLRFVLPISSKDMAVFSGRYNFRTSRVTLPSFDLSTLRMMPTWKGSEVLVQLPLMLSLPFCKKTTETWHQPII